MMHSNLASGAGVAELLRETVDDSATLVRLELAMARDEVKEDLLALKTSAILGMAAVVLGAVALLSLWFALALLLGPSIVAIVAGVLLLVSLVLALLSKKRFPTNPLGATRRRLETDKRLLGEQLS